MSRRRRRLSFPALPLLRAGGAVLWTGAELAVVEARMARRPQEAQEAAFEAEMRRWCRGLLRLLAIRLHIAGELPPATGPRLVIANHRAAIDIPIVLSLFGGSVLSRADVSEWPLLGYAARRAQTIFVDRDSPRSGIQAIRAIRAQLQRGRTISVFPEGTTSAGDTLLPFSAGAFAAARGLDVELLPLGIAYPPGTEYVEENFTEHILNVAGRRRIDIDLCVGPPLRLGGSPAAAATRLQELVGDLVRRARERAESRS